MSPPPRLGRWEVPLRVAAALLGTAPVALLLGVCLARVLPLPATTRFTLGLTLVLPLWVSGMCVGFVARSAARAWLACGVLSLALALLSITWGFGPR